ncbi:MAG: flippase-like domain-containing protein [Ruminococcus sp.]|nr:flippase-like domain-containing protein [Ruminococcus sp.]
MGKEKSQNSSVSLKKQIIYIVVFIALIAITMYVIVSRNDDLTLAGFIKYAMGMDIPWLIAGIGCVFLFILFEGLSIRYIVGKLGYKCGFYNSYVYSAADIYFSALTPSATGGQPASAYYMVKDKIPMSVTTITLVLNIMQYTLSIVVIAGMCFAMRPEYFFEFDKWSRFLIILGIVFQLGFALLFACVIFFPNIIKKIGVFFVNILAKIHLVKNREKKLSDLDKMIEDYRRCAQILKDTPIIIMVSFIFNVLQRVSIICVTYCVYRASGQTVSSFFDIIIMQGYVLIGSNSLPVPGAVGIADYLFLDGFKSLMADPVHAELMSRGLSFYICIIGCGAITLIHHAINVVRENKTVKEGS